ncbi:MAG TPA: hypothetical protein VFC79_06680, partial [Tissierellaceae bacterium]|nr:hypothetical protein [Tissierellaceae bacterium]
IIVYLNLILGTFIVFILFKKDLPFSRAFETTERRNGFLKLLLSVAAIGILVLIHYFSHRIGFGSYIYLFIQIIVIFVSSKYIFNVEPDN